MKLTIEILIFYLVREVAGMCPLDLVIKIVRIMEM